MKINTRCVFTIGLMDRIRENLIEISKHQDGYGHWIDTITDARMNIIHAVDRNDIEGMYKTVKEAENVLFDMITE